MTPRIALSVLIATLLTSVSTSAQSPGGQAPLAGRFVDPANGLSLEQAIARAIEQEPSLRAARSQVEVAQGAKSQASLRPNPSVSFEWRDEPGGTDHWPRSGSNGRWISSGEASVLLSGIAKSRLHNCRRGSRTCAGRRCAHAVWRGAGDNSRSCAP